MFSSSNSDAHRLVPPENGHRSVCPWGSHRSAPGESDHRSVLYGSVHRGNVQGHEIRRENKLYAIGHVGDKLSYDSKCLPNSLAN